FLGSKLWANRGTWNPSTTYRRVDVVFRLGSSYQYVVESQTAGDAPESTPTKWQILSQGSSLPFGAMLLLPTGAAVPTGYLRCNGVAVSRVTYANLFTVIGTSFGVGDGSTTFNLPNGPTTGISFTVIYTG
ncbi:phage tail protein, partial [Escherichia coli]|uniref:phage tail protein n=1 Tax=Escherichia coli TaxID=562 RepID=UPI0022F404A3